MTVAIWQASTSHAVGDIVAASEVDGYGFVFRCISSGTTDTTEPAWPSEIYKTSTVSGVTSASVGFVDDNTVRWAAISAVHADLQAIYPSSIIELFELELNQLQHDSSEILRFHAGTNLNLKSELVWQGNTYRALPIEAEGFDYNGQGQMPRPTVRVSNLYLVISTALAELPYGLEGAKVTRIRTLARYLDAQNFAADAFILQEDGGIFLTEDNFRIATEEGQVNPLGDPDPSIEFPREIYIIDRKVNETRDVVEFELASALDLQGVRLPRRQTIANICQWRYRRYDAATSSFDYRGVTCPYIGGLYFTQNDEQTLDPALDKCSKRLDGCRARFAPLSFTAPSIASGSTTISGLTVETISSLGSGLTIKGYGITSGTEIINAASGVVYLNAPITKTSPITASGLVGDYGTKITMTNASDVAKIFPGMVVTGTYIPANTTVKEVNYGTRVVTLSVTYNTSAYNTVQTFTGSLVRVSVDMGFYETEIHYIDTSSIATVGDTVTGTYENQRIYGNTTITSISVYYDDFGQPINRWQLSKQQQFGQWGALVNGQVSRVYTFSASSYTFTYPLSYVCRDVDLPFGGFPAVGAYKI